MEARGRVRFWHAEEGWGVIDSEATPGGCWAHFADVLVEGYRTLEDGQEVRFTFMPGQQDGYLFRALDVWPADRKPYLTPEDVLADPSGFRSELSLTFVDEDEDEEDDDEGTDWVIRWDGDGPVSPSDGPA